MEKLLEPYDKEYVKMAMLKHEETFKHQVHELHRIYRIQKLLMKSIKHNNRIREKQKRWDSCNGVRFNQINDLQHHYGDIEIEIEDESEIQLTLGPSSVYRRKKLTETQGNSDSGTSFSSSSTGSSNRMKRTNRSSHKWGLTVVSDSNSGLGIGRKSSFDVELAPNWLFKPLSLNMT